MEQRDSKQDAGEALERLFAHTEKKFQSPSLPTVAERWCADAKRQIEEMQATLPEGDQVRATLILPDGSTITIGEVAAVTRYSICCKGVNQAGLPAEVKVSASQAILKLEAAPASGRVQERAGFRAQVGRG